MKTKRVPLTANNLTAGVINFLKIQGHSASRINTAGVYDPATGRFRRTGGRKGFADICACIKGRAVAIEIKIGADKLSEHQVEFKNEWESAGGVFYECKNYTDFLTWYNDLFKKI